VINNSCDLLQRGVILRWEGFIQAWRSSVYKHSQFDKNNYI